MAFGSYLSFVGFEYDDITCYYRVRHLFQTRCRSVTARFIIVAITVTVTVVVTVTVNASVTGTASNAITDRDTNIVIMSTIINTRSQAFHGEGFGVGSLASRLKV